MLRNRLKSIHSDERGIALIVVMVMLVVLGVIAAAVFTNSLQIKNATAAEKAGKQAYAGSLNGLRSAMYWLNASAPADSACPPLPGQTVAQAPNATSGLCGPYESDNISAASSVTSQPLVNQRFTYWITPVMSSSTDTCTGTSPVVEDTSSGVTVRDRCITAIGQALVGTQVKSTTRVQARVSATNAQFPVPGIFGASCVSIGAQPQATGCDANVNGVSNSDYYGTIGSNGPVNAAMKNWNYDPATNEVAPAALYLGYASPTSTTIPTYSIKLQNNPAGTPTPIGCGGSGLAYCNDSQPPLPYNTSATGPYQNPVHYFGRWYQPFRMGNFFSRPDVYAPMVLPGHSLPTGCATVDVSACNNNALITSASSTPGGCATISSNRSLSVPASCVLKVPNGTYDFCDITLGKSAALLPSDNTTNAEIRIFLDNKNRTVSGSAACVNSTQGALNLPGNQFPRWMTNNGTQVSGADCINTAFAGDPWSALGGQLYVYGAGDPTDASTNYPPNVSSRFDIPGMNFNGSIMATNSTLNLTDSNTCVNGGLTAGAMNVANNAGFHWDPNLAKTHLSNTSTTYFRTAFSTCTAVGFRFRSSASAPTYPTYPSDGC